MPVRRRQADVAFLPPAAAHGNHRRRCEPIDAAKQMQAVRWNADPCDPGRPADMPA
jgi:hypothetical protein